MRRCTQESPSCKHSSHPCALGVTCWIWFVCVHWIAMLVLSGKLVGSCRDRFRLGDMGGVRGRGSYGGQEACRLAQAAAEAEGGASADDGRAGRCSWRRWPHLV